MFCKWCGADLSDSAVKCGRCGREVPALSDCGGFYDLVPSARNNGAVPVQQPPRKPERPEPVRKEPMKQEPQKKSGGALSLVICCVGFLLVLILIFSMQGKINNCLTGLEQTHKEIRDLSDQLQTDEAVPEETQALEAEAPVLAQQDIQIDIEAAQDDKGISVKTAADLGKAEQGVTSRVAFDPDSDSLTGLTIDLGEEKDCIVAKIKSSAGTSADKQKGILSVAMDVEEQVLGEQEGESEFVWEYRTDLSEWKELDDKVFTQENDDDGVSVSFSTEEVDKLLDEDAKTVEFRLTYTRKNGQGGSLVLVITGITIPRAEFAVKPQASINTQILT